MTQRANTIFHPHSGVIRLAVRAASTDTIVTMPFETYPAALIQLGRRELCRCAGRSLDKPGLVAKPGERNRR